MAMPGRELSSTDGARGASLRYKARPVPASANPMAEPLKNLIDASLIASIGAHLRRAWPEFPQRSFVRRATARLAELELKARVQHVAAALTEALPDEFAAAADAIERALAPARDDTDLSALVTTAAGLAGWATWPLCEFVAQRGLQQPQRALTALHALTQRSTAEYAIRPFLIEHEALTLATLHRWAGDRSAHVRRLVSEGSRPRLPWGIRLQRFCADPSPTLPLLERLQDDPSDYVRRSVANHLNDIAKDHPAIVVQWLERHLPGASAERRALLRHASRTLVKRGDRAVLAAFGFGAELRGDVEFVVTPTRASIGGAVTVTVTLRSRSTTPQRLVVDYVVHQVRERGGTSPKVRKGWIVDLAPRESRTLQKRHSLVPVSTRRDVPGHHAVDLLVNGAVVARSGFELVR